jgi:hypothetical protein
MPQTPMPRLGPAEARLKAMLAAMKTVRLKLVAFFDSLNDEQNALSIRWARRRRLPRTSSVAKWQRRQLPETAKTGLANVA